MTVTQPLTDAELDALVAGANNGPRHRADGRPFRLVQPLEAAADSLIHFASSPERRAYLNLSEIDAQTMGIGPGELAYVTGFSHSGKTQVILNALWSQTHKRTVIFTADEPASLVLAKLVSLARGINGRTLIERIQQGDAETRAMVYEVARSDFPNLLVVDGSLGFDDMTVGMEEAAELWGAPAEVVVVDYLGLIHGGGGGDDLGGSIVHNSRRLKAWTLEQDVPVLCMHQGTRSGSGKGQAATLADAAAYGGEAEAIFLLNVRRKKTALLAELRALKEKALSSRLTQAQEDRIAMVEYELPHHENTITVQLLKSKRPGSRLTHPDGIDYHLDPDTGIISPLAAPAPAPQTWTDQELF